MVSKMTTATVPMDRSRWKVSRLRKLEQITRETISGCKTRINRHGLIKIDVGEDEPLTVFLLGGKYIHVANSSLESYAIKLAKAYQDSGEKEFMILRGYE